MAGITSKDVDFAEVHDCFTVAEVVDTEDLGFFKKGTGATAAQNGETKLNGSISINPSGGLKSKGHPIGATGVGQIAEVFEQLTGQSGERTVNDAKIGLNTKFWCYWRQLCSSYISECVNCLQNLNLLMQRRLAIFLLESA